MAVIGDDKKIIMLLINVETQQSCEVQFKLRWGIILHGGGVL
jgi:hypothetical protein